MSGKGINKKDRVLASYPSIETTRAKARHKKNA
jgi:hypothetical protein